MSDPQADLIRRSQDGDESAFEALYRENVGAVYALCLRMTGDAQRATEVAQDVFVHAWRGLPAYRGEASFTTWLHRLAINALRQSHRAESRWLARVVATEDGLDRAVATPSETPLDRIDLERAIASLPRRAREALILHDIHGYRCREVADITGTAVGTIQAHLHRARKLLRQGLER